MDQRLSIVTLGVTDLARTAAFYERGLGFEPAPSSSDAIRFYQLNGIALALYPREALAKDAFGDEAPATAVEGRATAPVEDRGAASAENRATAAGFSGVTLAYNCRTEAEVDETLRQAAQAGARIVKAAEKVFWGGYSGYFADPDGQLWEVAFNPFSSLDEAGNFVLGSEG